MLERRCGICYGLIERIDDGKEEIDIEYGYDGCEETDTLWHYTHR